MRNIYLSKFYWKLKQRSCAKKAVVALARKILVIIYNLIKNNDVYKEEKFEQPMQKQESSRIKTHFCRSYEIRICFNSS